MAIDLPPLIWEPKIFKQMLFRRLPEFCFAIRSVTIFLLGPLLF